MEFELEHLDEDRYVALHKADKRELLQVADWCHAMRDMSQRGDARTVATVPAWIVQRYCDLRGITFKEFMRDPKIAEEFLKTAEVQPFRTYEGNV